MKHSGRPWPAVLALRAGKESVSLAEVVQLSVRRAIGGGEKAVSRAFTPAPEKDLAPQALLRKEGMLCFAEAALLLRFHHLNQRGLSDVSQPVLRGYEMVA